MNLARLQPLTVLCLLALVGCGGSTAPSGGGGDAAIDVATDAPGDHGGTPNPCEAGTCRLPGDTTGACLPPGGPISEPDSGTLSGCCGCGSDGVCNAQCECASPDTPIATPEGDRAIASLAVGDLVLSIDRGRVAAVPLRQVRRTPVTNHRVVEVVLRGGAVLRISGAHPTADGRLFRDLQAGDWLGGGVVVSSTIVPYAYDATYDVLPDSDTGTYFAGGVLVGSTLAKPASAGGTPTSCEMPAVAGQ